MCRDRVTENCKVSEQEISRGGRPILYLDANSQPLCSWPLKLPRRPYKLLIRNAGERSEAISVGPKNVALRRARQSDSPAKIRFKHWRKRQSERVSPSWKDPKDPSNLRRANLTPRSGPTGM